MNARIGAATVAVVLGALALGGCPLPQPLASVSHQDGGTVTPPRVLAESAQPADTVVWVKKDCQQQPQFTIQASIVDENVDEQVEARWFLDYSPDASGSYGMLRDDTIAQPLDTAPAPTTRALQPLTITFRQGDPAPLHVLELVVSNGFYPSGQEPSGALPNRTAQPGYEAQVFRWTFAYAGTGGICSFP